jgi:phosphatidate cytidylyltransferase
MLLARVLTGLVLATLVGLVILYVSPAVFAVIFGIFAAAGIYEWAGFMRIDQPAKRAVYVAVFIACAALLYRYEQFQAGILYLACVVWIAAILGVLSYPRGSQVWSNTWLAALLGLVIVGGAWVALVVISELPEGRQWLLWLFFLTSLTDIGGYFAGGALGKRRLAPRVSPGKTWEGAIGGALLAACLCGVALWVWHNNGQISGWQTWLAVMSGLIVLAVFGDLFESVMKRATGVKDSGTILPGHGGILDRMDSGLAVLPVFAVVLQV